MRRKMTTLKCKSGGVQNGNGAGHPRALIDLTVYREHQNALVVHGGSNTKTPHWDPQFSGWSNANRPRDHAIFLRPVAIGN
jgi:hypothetical protein